ncbi:MAG: hypothetical protein EOP13_14915 [Pseudomonas sp.]|uniref:hypothetical protein n=1 Tax=Pseudomonas sp. TaxID=306 RepID=UPI001225CD0B|nr:hypothetical protein [Pseudomonas sp.]RZI72494.1 MAG: hypothetical protein EOP13_14915 [Pseudomonas sp.]
MKGIFCFIVTLVVLLIGTGCASTRGAPRPIYSTNYGASLTADEWLKGLTSGKDSEGNGLTGSTRNQHIFSALAVADVRYSEFRQALVGDKNHTASVSDALVLAMTVAGALTESAGVKANYLQGIALVTGSSAIYDKNYLQSQTVSALIAQMDANRQAKRLDIIKQMTQSISHYPSTAAYNDVIEYYNAGTVISALMGIQAAAKGKEQEAIDDTAKFLQQNTIL